MTNGNSNDTDPTYEELRTLFPAATADIAFFKRQQFAVTNYCLLLYVVIVTIPKFINSKITLLERFILSMLSILAFLGSSYFLCFLNASIKTGRKRLESIMRLFTETSQRAWMEGKTLKEVPFYQTKEFMLGLFLAIIFIGLGVVNWLLWRC